MTYSLLEMNKNLSDFGINFSDFQIFVIEVVFRLFFDY